MKFIKQIEPYFDQQELRLVSKTLRSKFITEGKETIKFENLISKIVKSKNSISLSNWTLGLFCCAKAIDLKENDEVIVPNLTFVSCVTSMLMANLKVKLCEINNSNYSLDLNHAKKLITNKTKAIMIVHLYGECSNIPEILLFAKKYKLKIIEDAAQSFCGKYKGKHLGTFGDVGGYSFYGNKTITTGEGGIAICKKKKYFDYTNFKKIPKNNYEFDKKEYFKNLEISFNEFKKKNFFNKRNLSYPNIAYYLKKQKKKIDFYDIGANDLNNYFYLKKKFKKKIRYFFYDQEIKSIIIENFSKKNGLKDISVLKKNFKKINKLKKNNLSIFFLGSVIQYLRDHKKFLKKIIYLNPNRIMICGNIFYRNKIPSKKILMKQLNMHPQIFYQFFYNIENFVEFFKKNNYLLVLKEKNVSDKNLNLSNIKPNFEEIDRYNLIFEKKND